MSIPPWRHIRVEKGHAEPEELAAITAILLARAAARPAAGDRPTAAAPRPAGAAWSARAASGPRTAGTPSLRRAARLPAPGRAPLPRWGPSVRRQSPAARSARAAGVTSRTSKGLRHREGPWVIAPRLPETCHQCVLDECDQRALGVRAVAGVGGDDRGVGADLQGLADFVRECRAGGRRSR